MKTQVISAEFPGDIDLALKVLHAGQLVAFPTDTVYGLGTMAFDEEAVNSIYKAKDRPTDKAIPVLLGDSSFLPLIASVVPAMAQRLADRFWPGPLTLVIPKNPALPDAISASPTVGVRVPDHSLARDLLRAAGPMAVTSANASGRPNASTAQEVFDQLAGRIALILEGGTTPGSLPSTVVDCSQREPLILRVGPIGLEDINQALV